MRHVLTVLFISILSTLASAQIQTIDKSGRAYLLRDKQNAAIVVTGDAVQMLSKKIIQNKFSAITCAPSYCVVGQFNRAGTLSPLSGVFASEKYFQKFAENEKNPTSLSNALYFEEYGSKAYASPDQCQTPDSRLSGKTVLSLYGITAEQLYYFLNSKASKSTDADVFNCKKKAEYNYADLSEGGAVYPTTPISHYEYRCEIKFSKVGFPQKPEECRIYGGSISAGGGGKQK